MPKPPSPRIVLRTHADGSRSVFTRNLGELRRRLSDPVIAGFVRAFVLIDRLDSLVAFEYLTDKHVAARHRLHQRNHLTFLVFMVGTMFELSQILDRLRAALALKGLLDPAEWTSLLGSWDARWRNDPIASRFRNQAAFHVDEDFILAGLTSLDQVGRQELFGTDASRHRQDSSFTLGTSALLGGLGVTQSALLEFFVRPVDDLKVNEAVSALFLSTLDRVGITVATESGA